jgi:hypothetical protein
VAPTPCDRSEWGAIKVLAQRQSWCRVSVVRAADAAEEDKTMTTEERAKLANDTAELSDKICRLEDLGKDAPRGTIRGLKARLDMLRARASNEMKIAYSVRGNRMTLSHGVDYTNRFVRSEIRADARHLARVIGQAVAVLEQRPNGLTVLVDEVSAYVEA